MARVSDCDCQPLGPRLSLLSQYLPGYSVSVPGSLIGFAYFLVLGAIGSACVGWIYNALVSRTTARVGSVTTVWIRR